MNNGYNQSNNYNNGYNDGYNGGYNQQPMPGYNPNQGMNNYNQQPMPQGYVQQGYNQQPMPQGYVQQGYNQQMGYQNQPQQPMNNYTPNMVEPPSNQMNPEPQYNEQELIASDAMELDNRPRHRISNPNGKGAKFFSFVEKLVDLFKSKPIMLIPVGVIALILFILFINLLGTRSLKCNLEREVFGVSVTTKEVSTFKFGKIKKVSRKLIYDYSDFDYEKEDMTAQIKNMKAQYKESCKSGKGCSYSIKQKGDLVTISVTLKGKSLSDDYDNSYKEMKEVYENTCD